MAGINPDSDEPIAEINVVPLVDIILVVLIIFMVTAPLVLKPSIDVSLPEASSGEVKEAPKTIEVVVRKDGQVYYDGSVVSLPELKEKVAIESKKSADASVILTADKDVTLSGLTEIIDTIKGSGIKKVGFSIQKK
jgi:biopolymer transport protein ExbD